MSIYYNGVLQPRLEIAFLGRNTQGVKEWNNSIFPIAPNILIGGDYVGHFNGHSMTLVLAF